MYTEKSVAEPENSINLIYDELQKGIQTQIGSLSSLQNKASNLIGFSGAALALLFGSLTNPKLNLQSLARVSLHVGVIFAVIAMLLSSYAFWSRQLRLDPSPKVLLKKYYKLNEHETQLQIAVNRAEAFNYNLILIERIAFVLIIATLTQASSILFIAISIILLS